MPKHHNISEYIDNLSLKKSFCMGFHPDEVYGVICDLTSMYNKVLAEAYEENEALKQKLEEQTRRPILERVNASLAADNASPIESYEQKKTEEHDLITFIDQTKPDAADASRDEADDKDCDDAVADKDLQRLKRYELLEVIVGYSKENDRLKETVSALTEEKNSLQKKLEDKTIKIDNAGSLAEASFLVNGVLESAQAAARQYLDNLQELSKREEENCVKREAEANEYASKVISEAQKESEDMRKSAVDKCSAMILIATERSESIKREADEYSTSLKAAAQNHCREMEAETLRKCEEMERAAAAKCEAMNVSAAAETEKVWENLSVKLEDFYKAHEGLRDLLQAAGQFPKF